MVERTKLNAVFSHYFLTEVSSIPHLDLLYMDIGQISKCTYQVTHSSPLMITLMYLWPISRRIKHGNRDSCDHQRDGYLGRLCSSANDQFYALNALTGAII